MDSDKVVVASSGVKELRAVPKADPARIACRLQALAVDPRPQGCEKLSGQDRYRVRQGDYRIISAIDGSSKIVDGVRISHRAEVYC